LVKKTFPDHKKTARRRLVVGWIMVWNLD
jgi:hypothetical protein